MISAILKKFSGRHYKKFLKKCLPITERINAFEVEYQSLTEQQLRAKTAEFMQRHQDGESLDDLLPEAFATVKNAARRPYVAVEYGALRRAVYRRDRTA
jgi:preprotein translocase subunit SecA